MSFCLAPARRAAFLPFLLLLPSALAESPCPPTPVYSPCEIVFELSEQEAVAHPNPYMTVDIEAEFRSPRFRTMRMPGFWDGGRRFVIRFTPTGAGEWVYRVNSNVARFENHEGRMTATESDSPGLLKPATLHHWAFVSGVNRVPHLWMGDTLYNFPFVDRQLFENIIDTRAEQKFNHVRGVILPRQDQPNTAFPAPDRPDPAVFRETDERVAYMNKKGIIADLVLAWDRNHLAEVFPEPRLRERYIRYVVARYAPLRITWQGVQEFEEYENGRALMREIGGLLKKLDPYQHPRSTHTVATSAPLLGDDWMDYVTYQSSDDHLGAIEHQLYGVPFVNTEFAYEDSGAGRTHEHHVDTDTFRRRLWNATMNGQYPTFGNTGTYGAGRAPQEAKYLDSPGARQMSIWFDFFSRTRHWELQPYFDVSGGRALALERPRDLETLEGIEYIVYVEKAAPVEIVLQRHTYDVVWFNPITGESVKQKRFKGARYTGEPPSAAHDWVLHISREGRKESMLRSFRFDSRPVGMQEIEQNPQRVPYEVAEPTADVLSLSQPAKYAARVTRETRATGSMMWLWTGDVAAAGQGYRVIGTGQEGTFRIPKGIARELPATLAVRLYGMNANGKVYSLYKVYKLTQ